MRHDDRIQADIAKGDLGSARSRLASYAVQEPRAKVFQQLGDLSFEMKDLVQAGKYWAISGSDHPAAKECIRAFVDANGRNWNRIRASMPRHLRGEDIDSLARALPLVCAELGEPIRPKQRRRLSQTAKKRRVTALLDAAGGIGCLVMIFVMFGLALLGAGVVLGWVSKW